MSLSTSIAVLLGATGVTVTGGSASTFVNDGTGVNGKRVLVESSQTDPRLRKRIRADVTIGYVPLSGSSKLHRNHVVFEQPFIDSKGVSSPLPDELNICYHPEMSAAQRETKFWNTIAVLVDSELANLRNLIAD